MSPKRADYLDIAKGIGIILVIIGHSRVYKPIFNFIYAFHMPLFFIISGCLYNREKWTNLGFKALVCKKFEVYIIPYFVLSFINLLINMPIEYHNGIRGIDLLISSIKHIFWIFYSASEGNRTPYCSPLWFLTTIFLSNSFLYFIFKVNDKNKRLFIFLLFTLLCTYLSINHVFSFIGYMPWHIESALIGTVFMYVGYLIKELDLLFTKNINIWGVAFLIVVGYYAVTSNGTVGMAVNQMSNPVLFYIGAIFLSYALLWICANIIKSNRFLSYFGKNTIIVLGFNYAINAYSRLIWNKIPFLSVHTYTWYLLSIVNVISFLIIFFIWNKIKSQYNKTKGEGK